MDDFPTNSQLNLGVLFPNVMRVAPSLIYSGGTASFQWDGNVFTPNWALNTSVLSPKGALVFTTGLSVVEGQARLVATVTATAFIAFSAEL